ncbi:MAG TPA: hypothetical protein VLJ59_06030 [Mycobacteriales bacterium]|nr:hypothetical protein [Mycobacteriales bacterium]
MSDLWSVAVPTWLSSVGTVGAFATGGMLLVRELRRDRDRQQQEERARAGLIVAWPVRIEARSANVSTLETRLQLRNAGTEPVYGVELRYVPTGGGPEARDHVGILPPGDVQRVLPELFRETWIRSDRHWVRRPASGTAETADPLREPWRFQVSLRFVDAAGRRWQRRADGSLAPGE